MLFCLKQKWTLENSRLPEHLQRTLPQKPETQNISIDDWNQLAWEATQVKYAYPTYFYNYYISLTRDYNMSYSHSILL